MSEALARRAEREPLDSITLTAVVTDGDCSRLSDDQKRAYYLARCEAAGLDPRTAPFMFTKLNGKLVLYALKSASDQLASNNKVATTIIGRETVNDVHCVTVRATAADGRSTEDIGAVALSGLKGEALANALMKTVTKAKRRAVLSLCGLGMTDETELDSIPQAAQPRPAPIRGVVSDDAPPQLDPPHDPQTGEVLPEGNGPAKDAISPEQIALLDSLLLACADGFRAQEHKLNWLTKHTPEIQSLPKWAKDDIRKAYEAAATNRPEGK